jgi:hypothetical protein
MNTRQTAFEPLPASVLFGILVLGGLLCLLILLGCLKHSLHNKIRLKNLQSRVNAGDLLSELLYKCLQWLYMLFIAFGVALFDTLYLCEMGFEKCRYSIRLAILKLQRSSSAQLMGGVQSIASDALRAIDKRAQWLSKNQEEHGRNGDDRQRPNDFSHGVNGAIDSVGRPNVKDEPRARPARLLRQQEA